VPKIIVTILRLLTEAHECGNFKTIIVSSIFAVPSIFGRQNIQHVGRLFRNPAL